MSIFIKIRENIKRRKEYKTVFRPFFDAWKRNKKVLGLIDCVNIPDNVAEVYDLIKKSNKRKYKKDIELYESYTEEVLNHNIVVNEINAQINEFDKEFIYENILNYSFDKIIQYNKYAESINQFENVDSKYKTFVAEVSFLYKHFDKIKEQKQYYDSKTEIFYKIKNHNDYIDHEFALPLINEDEEINLRLKSFDFFAYDFTVFKNINEFIDDYNKHYVELFKNRPIFDDINNRSLDEEQREAVLTDEINTLVVAGAGSGKTLTICGKVKFLIEEKKVNPEDILLLSYSRKSADDLMEKISLIDDRMTVGTFHKLGLDILKYKSNKTYAVEEQFSAIIEKYFREEINNRREMLEIILSYYGMYISSQKHEKVYTTSGELFEELKKQDLSTLKDQMISLTDDIYKKETLKKELVKSYQELAIANWYFINGINYVYEKPYKKDVSSSTRRKYLPDFYLPDYDIYHEHYGINKDGKAAQFKEEEANEYLLTMEWKRSIHQTNETVCLETYSYEFEDDIIFKKLEKELKSRGVEFKPLSDEEIINALNSIYQNRNFKSFINLVKSFISLYKSKYDNNSFFEELKNTKYNNQYEKKRAEMFLCIVKNVYDYYMNYLREEDKIDFDDMILKSQKALDDCDHFKYKYIIVDEFQDISVSRMRFLKKLIEHGNAKLFAVGDDWQSIYRFSGCDLSIFLNFSNYFGYSKIKRITTTHRNSQELQDIAGPFIKKNPEQFDKAIKSSKHLLNPIRIMKYEGKKSKAFLSILDEINKIAPSAKILILGRNNKDFEGIAIDKKIYIDYKESSDSRLVVKVKDYPSMSFTYSTVHGSKGLEEDYVIIINADDARLGFPNKMEDDEILDLVLTSKSNYEYAEERRLWYVALTRTRNYTFIITSNRAPSIFVKEIEDQCFQMNPTEFKEKGQLIQCPECKTGTLVFWYNEEDGSKFYGCSNYPYCTYTIKDTMAVERNKRCKVCGDFMVYRKGRYGAFFGCHNYPDCQYKEKYEPNN